MEDHGVYRAKKRVPVCIAECECRHIRRKDSQTVIDPESGKFLQTTKYETYILNLSGS
jgi:hypothetical protein